MESWVEGLEERSEVGSLYRGSGVEDFDSPWEDVLGARCQAGIPGVEGRVGV